jgi:hypothetical protein
MSANIETILQSLTLEEKISLLAGKDFWETVPVPEKGVPAIKVLGGRDPLYEQDQLIRSRQVMVPMELEVSSSVVAQELHAFQQLYAQQRHGTQSMPTR